MFHHMTAIIPSFLKFCPSSWVISWAKPAEIRPQACSEKFFCTNSNQSILSLVLEGEKFSFWRFSEVLRPQNKLGPQIKNSMQNIWRKWPEKATESVQGVIENDWISALSLVNYTLYIHSGLWFFYQPFSAKRIIFSEIPCPSPQICCS